MTHPLLYNGSWDTGFMEYGGPTVILHLLARVATPDMASRSGQNVVIGHSACRMPCAAMQGEEVFDVPCDVWLP